MKLAWALIAWFVFVACFVTYAAPYFEEPSQECWHGVMIGSDYPC